MCLIITEKIMSLISEKNLSFDSAVLILLILLNVFLSSCKCSLCNVLPNVKIDQAK